MAADLIAVSGDPLESLDHLRTVDFVMVDGAILKEDRVMTPDGGSQPVSVAVHAGFPELFKAALDSVDRCQVRPDERVVIYADSEKNPALVEAWYAACVARGCDVILVRATARFPETDPPRPLCCTKRIRLYAEFIATRRRNPSITTTD